MLYVINALNTTLYKIGYSAAAPERRLNDLQTGCPYDLKLILVTEGEREHEAKIHNWMEAQGWRFRSEWFDIKNHDLFKLMFQIGLGKEVKVKPVSLLSNATSDKMHDLGVFDQYIERAYKIEKTSAFNTSMGTSFEDFYHDYYMYCKKYSQPVLKGNEAQKLLYERKIGYKIDDQGTYIFNLRKK